MLACGTGKMAVMAVCPAVLSDGNVKNSSIAPAFTCTIYHPPHNWSFIYNLKNQSKSAYHEMCVCVYFNCKHLTLHGKIAFGQNSDIQII